MSCAVRSMPSMPHCVLGRGNKESARGTTLRAYGLVARLLLIIAMFYLIPTRSLCGRESLLLVMKQCNSPTIYFMKNNTIFFLNTAVGT